MKKYRIRVSQRVFYNVEVDAEDEQKARDLVHAAIHNPEARALDEYEMREVDADEYQIEPT